MSIELIDAVWKHSKASSGALLTLLAIADNADSESGEAFPGVGYLAKKTRLSERAVKDATKRLVAMGELEIVERGGFRQGKARANRYRILVRPYVQNLHVGETKVQFAADEGAESAPQPSVEPSVVKEKNQRNDLDPSVAEVFAYWQERFGKGRSRLTPERRKKIEARLKQGFDVEQIKRAIDGCYQSDFHRLGNYTDLTLICRSEEKLEFFLGLHEPGGATDDDYYAGTPFA